MKHICRYIKHQIIRRQADEYKAQQLREQAELTRVGLLIDVDMEEFEAEDDLKVRLLLH
jgi:hypothetical protein